MMDVPEALAKAQDIAHDMLVENFDLQRGIPVRTASHSDLWPGDRWPEAYLAAGEPSLALAAMNAIASSVRRNGAVPHLMQGSHMRSIGRFKPRETRWVDRFAYIQQGNGITHSARGEWVTRAFAPPTQALSALAIEKAGMKIPSELNVAGLTDAALALYDARGTEDGLIATRKRDELTRSKGELSQGLKKSDAVVDPAINALMVVNNDAIAELAARTRQPLDGDFRRQSVLTRAALLSKLAKQRADLLPEHVLAIARLGHKEVGLRSDELAHFYTPPARDDPHPELGYVSMAETIEVARLTPWSRESYEYLGRVLTLVAQTGAAALTQFEGIYPGKNAVANKYNRKNAWLPTAAEIVRIDRSML